MTTPTTPVENQVVRQNKDIVRTQVIEILSATANGCLSELGYFPGMAQKFQLAAQTIAQLETENAKLFEDNSQLQRKNTKLYDDNYKLARITATQNDKLAFVGASDASKLQMLQELSNKVRLLSTERAELLKRIEQLMEGTSNDQRHQRLVMEFQQLQARQLVMCNEVARLREGGKLTTSAIAGVASRRTEHGLPTPVDKVSPEVGRQPMSQDQLRRRVSEVSSQPRDTPTRTSEGPQQSATGLVYGWTPGPSERSSQSPIPPIASSSQNHLTSALGPLPSDAIPISSTGLPAPPRPRRKLPVTAEAPSKTSSVQEPHNSKVDPLQQPTPPASAELQGSFSNQSLDPSTLLQHPALAVSDNSSIQTVAEKPPREVIVIDSPTDEKPQSSMPEPVVVSPKRRSTEPDESRKRSRLEDSVEDTAPAPLETVSPVNVNDEEQQSDPEEEDEEDNPLQDLVDSVYQKDAKNKMELTCRLCSSRFANGMMSEEPQKFVDASLDELVTHVKSEHPPAFERLYKEIVEQQET